VTVKGPQVEHNVSTQAEAEMLGYGSQKHGLLQKGAREVERTSRNMKRRHDVQERAEVNGDGSWKRRGTAHAETQYSLPQFCASNPLGVEPSTNSLNLDQ